MYKESPKYNKVLVVDSSGLSPWFFTMKEENITPDILDTFLRDIEADYYLSGKAQHEFLTTGYLSQLSIFSSPFDFGNIQKFDTVYLSDAGYLSVTTNSKSRFTFFNTGDELAQPSLWSMSEVWPRLSEEDRDVIQTTGGLTGRYSCTAILTNDWDLRQQCTRYEGIEARGTCSMLAGLVLGGYISYQRGTYIFGRWLLEEPRWVPTVLYPERRKFIFREILDEERRRQVEKRSFWSLSGL